MGGGVLEEWVGVGGILEAAIMAMGGEWRRVYSQLVSEPKQEIFHLLVVHLTV